MRTRVLRSTRHPVTQRTSSSARERARDVVFRRRTPVMIDYTQLAVKQPDSGSDRARQREMDPRKPAGSTQSKISLGTGRCVALWLRRDSSQQDRLEEADRREVQIERASKLERRHRAVAQLQESRDTLFDGTPEQNATRTRNTNRIPAASPGRVTQTRGDPGRERRSEDLSGRLITAAHASVDSWGETRTRLDYVLEYTQHQERGSDWLARPR